MTKNKRYSLDFEECDAIWIDDNVENKSYTIRNDTIKEKELEKIVDLLNKQDQRITELESNPAFQRVLQLIEERNLTWGAVADILDEHTILLEDVVTDGYM